MSGPLIYGNVGRNLFEPTDTMSLVELCFLAADIRW